MAGFTEQVTRANVPIPDEISTEILKEAPQASALLTHARKARMSTKKSTQPVLSVLPEAYWLSGDTALKQTTHAEWASLSMTAEELAVLVPIPNAVIDDTNIPIWDEIRPLLSEAIGKKVDEAAIWGVNKPASWPVAIVPGASAAGNLVSYAPGDDLTQKVAELAGLVSEDGFAVNGFMTQPGFQWKLIGLRANDGHPIYDSGSQSLYGQAFDEVRNGSWQATTPATTLIALDYQKFVVGIRQDITFDLFDQMVISDAAGVVVFNSAQQDSKVMRVVFRVGFQVANPLTRVNQNPATRYPAGVLKAA